MLENKPKVSDLLLAHIYLMTIITRGEEHWESGIGFIKFFKALVIVTLISDDSGVQCFHIQGNIPILGKL